MTIRFKFQKGLDHRDSHSSCLGTSLFHETKFSIQAVECNKYYFLILFRIPQMNPQC